MCACECVCAGCICILLCMDVWCLEYVRMKMHTQRNKFEIVSWMYGTLYVAKVATEWLRKIILFLYIYVCVCVYGGDFN